jgi:uncharacterized membrane protein
MEYHFGVPGFFIWISHILIGLLLSYVGYQLVFKNNVNHNIGLIILVIGVMAVLYHVHIWYNHYENIDGDDHDDDESH